MSSGQSQIQQLQTIQQTIAILIQQLSKTSNPIISEDLNMVNKKITNCADGQQSQDVVTKSQLDALALRISALENP